MIGLRKYIFIALVVLVIGFLIWLTYIQNANIETLRAQGKNYNVGTTVVTPAKDGESAYQIAVDNGFTGSQTDWLLSLVSIPLKGDNGMTAYQLAVKNGYTGSEVDWLKSLQGTNAPAITDDQIAQAVASYCQNGVCQGVQGLTGASGTNGANGENPVLACVIRSNPAPLTTTTKYLDWKYPTEPDTAYRDLYKLPTWAECTTPVDLTTPIIPVIK